MAYAFAIQPDAYETFGDESALIEKCKTWGLLSDKATKTKAFFYKGNGLNVPCSLIGYVDDMTAVIEFDNKQLHCIHPSYLKEMQASTFSQRISAATEASLEDETAADKREETAPEPKKEQPAKKGAKKEKPQLPEEKVPMRATVQAFTTVPNNFSDTEDEVVIYGDVSVTEPEFAVGAAWSSHSSTLKKLELAVGDTIVFEAKIIKKKLTKHPVPYKINNPSKIQKT